MSDRRLEAETLDAHDADVRALAATQRASATPSGTSTSALVRERAHPMHFAVLAIAVVVAAFLVEHVAHFLLGPFVPRSTLLGSDDATRWPFVRPLVEGLTYLTGGLVLSRRRPADPVLQLAVIGMFFVGVNSATVATLTTIPEDAPPLAWRVVAVALYTLAPIASFVILAVYPSGKPVPRFALLYALLGVAPFVVFAATLFREHRFAPAPLLVGMGTISVMLGFQAYRYRHHATIRQRHQIKWIAYGAALFIGLEVLALVLFSPRVDPESPSHAFFLALHEAFLFGAYLVPFLSLAFSAAQYRLWDVDRLINRSLVYATLTLVLAGVFFVVFLGIGTLVVGALEQSDLVGALVGASVVIALFAPTRRLVRRWVDHRFYGIHLDYEELARRATHVGSLPVEGDTFASFVQLQLLGRGGMGAVYKASHPDYGFEVVLKVLSREFAADPLARARFQREAATLESIDHPNVVPFLDRGDDYLVMTYVAGRDLAARIAEGPLPLAEALPILRDVAAALDAVHAKGIVHRDVKPANVLLAKDRAMLMDFGVARAVAAPSDTEDVVGTLWYIAPEQVHDPRNVDGRADLYALGVTAFEMLTGTVPFPGSDPLALALAHLQLPPPPARSLVAELPAHVEAALDAALSKRPEDRPASAMDFVRRLSAP